MKKFVGYAVVFLLLIVAFFYLLCSLGNGYTDAAYIRFTTPRQHALILGTSRAAQGIIPAVLNEELLRNDFFNYSFSINLSPYGPSYLESIRRKLDPGTKHGIFIMAVDPWGICSVPGSPNDSSKFKELDFAIAKVKSVNTKINVDYFLNGYDQHFWDLIFKRKSRLFLHQDGWLEITVPMDSVSIEKRIISKAKEYKTLNLPDSKFSQTRYEYLIKTIDFLKEHGDVYLVRLPVHPSVMEIEEGLMPDFNNRILEITNQTGTRYYDMSDFNSNFIYTDGSHLYKESAKTVSKAIANWILSEKKL